MERDILLAYDPAASLDDWPIRSAPGSKAEITAQEKKAAKTLIAVMDTARAGITYSNGCLI